MTAPATDRPATDPRGDATARLSDLTPEGRHYVLGYLAGRAPDALLEAIDRCPPEWTEGNR